jgi:Glycosyltransferase family 87
VAGLIRREWLAVLCGVSALSAAVTAVVSAHPAQRAWGMFATGGYCAACLAALAVPRLRRAGAAWPHATGDTARLQGTGDAARRRGSRLAVLAALGGAVFAPLAWLATAGRAQPEVGVILRSAALFLHGGTPYVSAAALASAHSAYTYDPYLPALIVFGLPRALLGGGLLTDPRVWFGAVFVVTFGAALAIAGTPRPGWWVAAVTASPVIAFPLSVGGDDLPVLGLLCLGLAVAASGRGRSWPRAVAAGLILGLAAAMKATAWPALAVALVLIGARQGRRAATVFGLAAAAVVLFADGPALAVAPGAMVANTIEFPLGMAKVASPAASALPGHLIAAAVPGGRWVAVALVLISGVAVGVSLLVRPPKDVQAAGWRLVIGLTLMFLLAPASRAGYFLYPLGLSAWLLLTRPRGPGGLGRLGRPGWLGRLGGLSRAGGAEQQVVDDPVPPQQLHLP